MSSLPRKIATKPSDRKSLLVFAPRQLAAAKEGWMPRGGLRLAQSLNLAGGEDVVSHRRVLLGVRPWVEMPAECDQDQRGGRYERHMHLQAK